MGVSYLVELRVSLIELQPTKELVPKSKLTNLPNLRPVYSLMDEPLVSTLAHLQAGVFTCAAAGTVVAYDILLTTSDEVRFTWPSKLSLPKCLYFVVRLP